MRETYTTPTSGRKVFFYHHQMLGPSEAGSGSIQRHRCCAERRHLPFLRVKDDDALHRTKDVFDTPFLHFSDREALPLISAICS
jgi:hypothetical protein